MDFSIIREYFQDNGMDPISGRALGKNANKAAERKAEVLSFLDCEINRCVSR